MLVGMVLGSIFGFVCSDAGDAIFDAFIGAPYGFAVGPGIWLFYRLVRFAVRG